MNFVLKHFFDASMVSLETLLSIWGLREDDDGVKEFLATSKFLSEEEASRRCSSSSGEYDKTRGSGTIVPHTETSLSCCNCSSLNDSNSSWCVECGRTLLEGTASSREIRSVEQQLQAAVEKNNSDDFTSELYDITVDSIIDQVQDDRSTSSVLLENIPIDRAFFNDELMSQPSKLIAYERKWGSSSSYYMWQKPSSLIRPSPTSSSQTSNITLSNASVTHSDSTNAATQLLKKSTDINFISLPTEILLYILSYLSPSDVAACGLVCKRIRQVSMLDYRKTITLRGKITDCTLKQVAMLQPSILVFKNCKAKSLSITEIDKGIAFIGKRLKRLMVDMCDMGSYGTNGLLSAVANYCPCLTSLELHWTNINDCYLVQVIKTCKSLEELCLIDVSGITAKEWHKIAKKLTLLEHFHTLRVALCPEIPLPSLLPPSQSLTSLKSLAIRQNINKITVEDITALLYNTAPNIGFIQIECIEVSEEVLQYIENKGIKLQLNGLVNVSDESPTEV